MHAVLALLLVPAPLPVGAAFEEVRTYPAQEAHQAVAADVAHFYAIGNRVIAKYRRDTGERVARIEASPDLPLIHMNGGVVVGDELIVSHSNFPFTPMTGSVESFSFDPLAHRASVSLGPTDGSLTSALRMRRGRWLLTFAHYELPLIPGYRTGSDRTRIEVRAALPQAGGLGYVLPASIVRRLRPHSVSGASLDASGRLWLSGHDFDELYRVRFPKAGSEMVLEAVHPAPIHGQGIAWDPVNPALLWGTRRDEGLVVLCRLKDEAEGGE